MIRVSLLVSHHWHSYWFAFKISCFSNAGHCQWFKLLSTTSMTCCISQWLFGLPDPVLCNFSIHINCHCA